MWLPSRRPGPHAGHTSPKGWAGGRAPRCSLLSAGGPTRVVPAAAGSAPLLAGRPQRPTDVAAAACGQEAPVYIPAMLTSSWSLIKGAPQRVGRPGPLFLFHCIRFHIGPGPAWISSSSTSAPSYLQISNGCRRNKVCKPSQPGTAAQRPCSLFPTLPGLCGPADGGRISSFSSSHGHDGKQPTPRVRVHLLPTGGRGTAARTQPPGSHP